MKITEFRKLVQEEIRKSINSSKKRLHEAVKPVPVDSSTTTGLVFLPFDDVDGLADYVADEGGLANALYIFKGPKTGIIVNKSDAREAVQAIKDYTA